MPPLPVRHVTGPVIICKLACAGVAAAVAYAFIHGRPAPALAAAAVVAAMVVAAWRNSTRPRAGTSRRSVRTGRRPKFHTFLVRRLGSSRRPIRFLRNFLLRPLFA